MTIYKTVLLVLIQTSLMGKENIFLFIPNIIGEYPINFKCLHWCTVSSKSIHNTIGLDNKSSIQQVQSQNSKCCHPSLNFCSDGHVPSVLWLYCPITNVYGHQPYRSASLYHQPYRSASLYHQPYRSASLYHQSYHSLLSYYLLTYGHKQGWWKHGGYATAKLGSLFYTDPLVTENHSPNRSQ